MDRPSIEAEVTMDLPEHQMLLSFVNDDDAVKFSIWWDDLGFKAFSKWSETHDRYGDSIKGKKS